jgi:hypothetical protein
MQEYYFRNTGFVSEERADFVKISSSCATRFGFENPRIQDTFPSPLSMFIPNQKVVCVDDKFPLGIEKLYNQLPVKDQIYVIRDIVPGQSLAGTEGEVAVYLIGLVNPTNKVGVERGFNAERFAPLSYKEVDDAVAVEEGEEVFEPLRP